ncbi:hypothetical protein [Tardiphaga sp. 768_D3_N2_1]|uniref:hypothetical protein n=1 Tax=Tardiphaga sp. 768_D3_N2_1 TaxID=3240783 RepID=UPI003F8A38C2
MSVRTPVMRRSSKSLPTKVLNEPAAGQLVHVMFYITPRGEDESIGIATPIFTPVLDEDAKAREYMHVVDDLRMVTQYPSEAARAA